MDGTPTILPFDPFGDDQDAHYASLENLEQGGPGVWYDGFTNSRLDYMSKRRQRRRAMIEEDNEAKADALRDMENDNASGPRQEPVDRNDLGEGSERTSEPSE